ncbi:hypothetical protein [Streptomyces sp. NPDC093094]|uniref:hypothetical protein n=1 Tax=Streptomyces sp. NPDC093094 TaxID=3366026 RepID=UPI003801D491
MTRRPSRPARAVAAALALGALLATGACSDGDDDTGASDTGASPGASAGTSRAAAPAARATTTAPAVLTQKGAETALITEADIEDDWTQVKDAQDWHDSMLIGSVDVDDFISGKSDAADCQKLLDGLYDENLLGKPSGASAVTGFEMDDSRLYYQVASYGRSSLDSSMKWLGSLPDKCDRFTVTGSGGGDRVVEVIETDLPDKGDAHEALQVTVEGESGGNPATLTLNVGVVRVGDNAVTVIAGGLDGGEEDSMETALEQGTDRLNDVLAGRSPAASPTGD